MKQGRTLVELAQEIQRQNDAKKDYLADIRSMRMNPEDMRLEIVDSGKENLFPAHSFDISDIAHQQIGTNLGIPAKYYERMRESQPEFLSENVNVWLQEQPQNRMIRTLDGRARAFLSDHYRRIDNAQIAETELPMGIDMEDDNKSTTMYTIKIILSIFCHSFVERLQIEKSIRKAASPFISRTGGFLAEKDTTEIRYFH